jgi:hypothetical protein
LKQSKYAGVIDANFYEQLKKYRNNKEWDSDLIDIKPCLISEALNAF